MAVTRAGFPPSTPLVGKLIFSEMAGGTPFVYQKPVLTGGPFGDTTLSGGIRRLAARRLMRAFDIGEARWCDIDTTSDLADAESVLSAAPGAA